VSLEARCSQNAILTLRATDISITVMLWLLPLWISTAMPDLSGSCSTHTVSWPPHQRRRGRDVAGCWCQRLISRPWALAVSTSHSRTSLAEKPVIPGHVACSIAGYLHGLSRSKFSHPCLHININSRCPSARGAGCGTNSAASGQPCRLVSPANCDRRFGILNGRDQRRAKPLTNFLTTSQTAVCPRCGHCSPEHWGNWRLLPAASRVDSRVRHPDGRVEMVRLHRSAQLLHRR
jgi:hypothetical protein